jgi:hypothetical protein
MNMRLILALLVSLVLTVCGGGSSDSRSVNTPPATNGDGTIVTKVATAVFNPSGLEVPIPTNLLLQTTNPDLTLRSLGPAGSTDYGNPLVALGQLDGWSTIEKWAASFVDDNRVPTALSASSVVPGGSVRFFEIIIDPATTAVLGIKRELTPGVDYWAAASGSNLAIIPLQPLKEMTAYMAVLTDGITDADGNDATPDQTYFLAKRTDPLVDSNGNSTDPLLDDATARALEPLRQLVNTQEAAAASAGVDPASIVLSWTANTLAVTPVLKVVRGLTRPAPTTLVATGMNTSAFGLPGIADIYMGVITLNYYLGVPDASDPDALLTDFWTAEPGAYVPPSIRPGSQFKRGYSGQSNPLTHRYANGPCISDDTQCGQWHDQAGCRLAGGHLRPWPWR